MKKNQYVKIIVFVGVFIALDIALTRPFRLMSSPVNFSFAVMTIAGATLGPLFAGLTAYLSDLTGFILFPQGPYFIGYALTAVGRAVIYGLFFYKKTLMFKPAPDAQGNISKKNLLIADTKTIAKISACSLCIYALNLATLPLWDVYNRSGGDMSQYWVWFYSKLLPYGMQFGTQVAVTFLLFKYLHMVIKKSAIN